MLCSSPLRVRCWGECEKWQDSGEPLQHRPIARRWLCKQRPLLCNARNIHACNNRTTGNATPFYAMARWKRSRGNENSRNNRKAVFSMWYAPRPSLCSGAVKTPTEHYRICVICVVRAKESAAATYVSAFRHAYYETGSQQCMLLISARTFGRIFLVLNIQDLSRKPLDPSHCLILSE
jgi:hypothetical protein